MLFDKTYGIIILAAGNSSRLGKPKQLLHYGSTTLLRNVVDESLKVPDAVVAVITGAFSDLVEKELADKPVCIYHNSDWSTGMASSIRTGIRELTAYYPALEAIIITVCDQPFLDAGILNGLLKEFETSYKGIVASSYGETTGTPALFSKNYFEELMQLGEQQGAKKLILAYPEDTATVPFPRGETDIDTDADYQQLQGSGS
jgi:molybdenum cofactor cytidylyltransferase